LLSSPPPPTFVDAAITDAAITDAAITDAAITLAANWADPPVGIKPWLVGWAAAGLVTIPVFLEAPLVRSFPGICLAMSLIWAGLSIALCRPPKTQIWGELMVGFTWTWVCGALFWGWLRWEPIWHLPVEALGLPIAVWGLRHRWAIVGQWFYLGSLLGTAITDIYFYLTDLMPAWRQLMRVDPAAAGEVFAAALHQMYTSWGIGWAIGLAVALLVVGIYSLKQKYLSRMAFGGAVLSTILVDGLFWIAAALAD
jgi:Protein of unknown function (DUF3120)